MVDDPESEVVKENGEADIQQEIHSSFQDGQVRVCKNSECFPFIAFLQGKGIYMNTRT